MNAVRTEKLSKSLIQMYNTGLDLQSKLDKIMDYDNCNEDTAAVTGM